MDFSIVTEIAGIALLIILTVIAITYLSDTLYYYTIRKRIIKETDYEREYQRLLKEAKDGIIKLYLSSNEAQNIFRFLISKQNDLKMYKTISLSVECRYGHLYPQLSFEDKQGQVKIIRCDSYFTYNIWTGEVK